MIRTCSLTAASVVWASATAAAQISTPISKQGLRVEITNIVQMLATSGTVGEQGDHTPSAHAWILTKTVGYVRRLVGHAHPDPATLALVGWLAAVMRIGARRAMEGSLRQATAATVV